MLKQLKGKTSDSTLDSISPEDEFSDLGALDDSNSMYMVSWHLHMSFFLHAAPYSKTHLPSLPSACFPSGAPELMCTCSSTGCWL